MFSANALPKVADKSLAWYSRWKFVEFPKTFPINPAYKFKLMKAFDKEKSGIFNWALEGLIRLKQTNEFTKGTALLEAEREYRHENDNVSAFLDEVAIKSNQNVTSIIPTFTLHSMYNDWIEKHLDGSVAVGQVEFTKRIKSLGIKKQSRVVNNKSCNCFLGIVLKPEYESLYEYHEQIRKMQR
jgi:phage/plasmid-associated DNA primase